MEPSKFIKSLKAATFDEVGPVVMLLIMWAFFTLLVHIWLTLCREKGVKNLFRLTAIVGMICLSFAFGQNDLANCASPGLSALYLYRNMAEGTVVATEIEIPMLALFACGVLMVIGMSSKNAQRVTRASVNTGSQYDHVALYAPKWCRRLARVFIKDHKPEAGLALGLGANFFIRFIVSKRSAEHEVAYHMNVPKG